LLASYAGGIGEVLDNGVPVTDLSGAQTDQTFYRIDVPAGQTSLEIQIFGGTGDCDLYVKFGEAPTMGDYDYRPFLAGNDETVSINNPAAGTWYIMLRGYSAYSGVTLVATYGEVLILENNVPVTNIAGSLGSERVYKIDVPSGKSVLKISISDGTGNCDLYVRRGARPTTANWDYRPYLAGNNETVTINNPEGGTWYIMLRARTAYSGVTLNAHYWFAGSVTLLNNGVPVTDISGSEGSERYYRIIVPSGRETLEISISGGTGDADLYVKRDAVPTTTDSDHRPFLIGNEETVTIDNPSAGTYFIMLRGYQAYTGVTLVATYVPLAEPVVTLENGVPVSGLSGAAGSEKFYKIGVPAGQDFLNISISGGTGDCDLYVKKGAKPTTTSWDYRPHQIGNDESVEIAPPAEATWYVMLRAHQAYAGVTLLATYGVIGTGNHFASDTNCVALWRFEPGQLTVDSIGTNTLENHGVQADTADYREGDASAKFRLNEPD